MKNNQKTSIFQKWTVSVFDMFPFLIHFPSSVFQVAKGHFGVAHPFFVAPYDNHLILFTIHTTEQAKKLR